MQNPSAPPVQNELTPRELFASVQKAMKNTDKALDELQAERREYRKLSDELMQEHAKYVDLLTKHMQQSKALMLDVVAQLKTAEVVQPVTYEYKWLEDAAESEVCELCLKGWELYRENEIYLPGADEILHIAKFRRPVTPPTAPETDAEEKDLSLFENALPDDDDPEQESSNPNETKEVQVVPEIPDDLTDDDGGETAPVEPVTPEREPAPVGYIEVAVSGCYLRGTHLQGNVFADVASHMIPVGMIERDRETGRYIVSLKDGETLNMGGHDDLYRKVEAERVPDSPAVIAPIPATAISEVKTITTASPQAPESVIVYTNERFPKVNIPSTVAIPGSHGEQAREFAKATLNG